MATPPDQNFVPPPPAATGAVDPLPAHPLPPHLPATHLLNNDLSGLGTSVPPAVQGDFAPTTTITNDPTQLASSPTNNAAATNHNESRLVDDDSRKRPRDDEVDNVQEEEEVGTLPPHDAIKTDGKGGTNNSSNVVVVKKPIKRKRSSVGGGGSTSYGGGRNGGSSSSDSWNDMLFELLKFRAKKGHCNVPKTGPLGRWVARQRLAKPKNVGTAISSNCDGGGSGGTSTKTPATPGTRTGLGGNTTAANTNGIPAADADNAKGGAGNTSTTTVTSKSSAREENDGTAVKRYYLSQDRIDVLESIGFVWDPVQADYDEKWKKRFDELVEFVRVNGHFSVSQTTPLGKWIKIQRENKKEADLKKAGMLPKRSKQRPCLSDERIEKLESIGFQWTVKKPPIGWENRYQQLVAYKNENGHCNVPQSYPDDRPFGRWVMKQRCEYSLKVRGEKSQLRDDREQRLNALGFNWVAPCVRKKTFVTSTLQAAAAVPGGGGDGGTAAPDDDGMMAGDLRHHDSVVDEVVEAITPASVVDNHHHTSVQQQTHPLPQQQQQHHHVNHHPLAATQEDVPMQQQATTTLWEQTENAEVV